MSTFALYKLPIVVLRELVKQFGLAEIFNVSIISRRSQRNVELLMRPGKTLDLHLNVTENSMISVQRNDEYLHVKVVEFAELMEEPTTISWVNINGTPVPMAIVGQTLYLTDKESALKEVTKHISKVFRCKVQGVSLGDSCSFNMPSWVIDFVNSQQSSIKTLWLDGEDASVEDLSYVLTEAKISDELQCSLKFSKKGPQPDIQVGQLSMKQFKNEISSRMTIEHLLNLNFEFGDLEESSFRSKDINTFLKHWMSGGCERLYELHIELKRPMNFNKVLREIDFEVIPFGDVKEFDSKKFNDTLEIRGGVQVRRKTDGKIARLLEDGADASYFSIYVFE
ncbi:hypothetical protein CAEBREN_15586 [Caenorhabditis brenneri]|uniref:F-box domain-containing protein n=1 Tax=Caenorhabditis brenneri TaxID=135651 RepID=G0NVC5_CAEBE|nr:hypothetical protein CAEBREN_15586 [Caenorhabditis brenneri]